MKKTKLLKLTVVAEIMGVSPRYVRAIIQKKSLRAMQLGGKSCPWLVDEDDVNSYMSKRYNRDR